MRDRDEGRGGGGRAEESAKKKIIIKKRTRVVKIIPGVYWF